jgi:hypothetical protein
MQIINYFADIALLLLTCFFVTYYFNKYASWRERNWLVMISVWIGEHIIVKVINSQLLFSLI